MRTLLTSALLGLTFIAMTPTIDACCGDDCLPSTIKFPNVQQYSIQRGDYLVFISDHRSVVDLKTGKIFNLGKVEGRWFDIDVADGQALLLKQNRLQVVALDSNKVVHDVDAGKERVYSLGFVGKDKA